jgi:iron complex transport system substrate-binding protein
MMIGKQGGAMTKKRRARSAGLAVPLRLTALPRLPRLAVLPRLAALLGLAALCLPWPAFAAPKRVISTFLCTDEYVFRLLPRDRIAALSVLAGNHPPVPPVVSTIADRIGGIALIEPSAEAILELKPDLVVMYQGTNPRLHDNLQSAGIPILDVPWANSIGQIRKITRMLGRKLGAPRRAAALVEKMDAALAEAKAHALFPPVTALIYEPNGYATSGGVAAELLRQAGLIDSAASLNPTRLGRVPVEAVVAHPPQLLILNAARGAAGARADQVLQNPALASLKGRSLIVHADLKPLLCPGPWSVKVLKQLEYFGRRAAALAPSDAPH